MYLWVFVPALLEAFRSSFQPRDTRRSSRKSREAIIYYRSYLEVENSCDEVKKNAALQNWGNSNQAISSKNQACFWPVVVMPVRFFDFSQENQRMIFLCVGQTCIRPEAQSSKPKRYEKSWGCVEIITRTFWKLSKRPRTSEKSGTVRGNKRTSTAIIPEYLILLDLLWYVTLRFARSEQW